VQLQNHGQRNIKAFHCYDLFSFVGQQQSCLFVARDLDAGEVLEVHGVKHVLSITINDDHILFDGRALWMVDGR
jgi:hypothetical protein